MPDARAPRDEDDEPAPLAASRRALGWLPTPTPIVPLVVLLWVSAAQSTQRGASAGDQAVEELGTSSAIHLHQLLGPYSRFGWDHPGPALYYWAAPFYALAHHQIGGLSAAAAAANLIALAAVLVALRRGLGRSTVAVWSGAVVVVGWLLLLDVERLHDPWNPLIVIVPVAAAGVCGAAVVAGRRWFLPVAAAFATFAVQSHVGSAPLIAVFAAVCGALTFWVHRAGASHRPNLGANVGLEPSSSAESAFWGWPVVATVAVVAALWSLPLYQELARDPGNLGLLATYVRHSHPHPGLSTVVRIVVPTLTVSVTHLGHRLTMAPSSFPHLDVVRVLLLVGLLALAAAGLTRRGDGGSAQRFRQALSASALAGAAASFVAGASSTSPASPYLFTAIAGVGLVLWLAAVVNAVELLAGPVRRLGHADALRAGGSALAVAGSLVAMVMLSVQAAGVAPYAQSQRRPAVEAATSAIRHRLPPGTKSVELDIGRTHNAWTRVAGAAAELERSGIAVHVPRAWQFMFGADRHITGHEWARFLLAYRGDPTIPAASSVLETIADPGFPPIELIYVFPTGTAMG